MEEFQIKTTKKNKLKKVIRIILLSTAGLVLLVSLSAYLILHNYINKINLATPKKSEAVIMETNAPEEFSKIDMDMDNDIETSDLGSDDIVIKSNEIIDDTAQETIVADGSIAEQAATNAQDAPQEEKVALDAQIDDNVNNNEIMEDSKVMNILLIGSDTRNSDSRGRSDSMIVLTVNKDQKTLTTTSFLRDIYVQIPDYGKNRLNAAYALGGADLLMETMEMNFKINIERYVMADFFVFIDVVDAVGGITVEITEDEVDTINNYIREINGILGEKSDSDFINKTGEILLNGKQALGYSRNRYTPKGDFDRTDKQREVIFMIYDKVKQQSLPEMNTLLNTILPQVTTNFTEGEMIEQLLLTPAYLDYDIDQCSVPISGTYKNMNIDGKAVLGIDFEENIAEIQRILYDNE